MPYHPIPKRITETICIQRSDLFLFAFYIAFYIAFAFCSIISCGLRRSAADNKSLLALTCIGLTFLGASPAGD